MSRTKNPKTPPVDASFFVGDCVKLLDQHFGKSGVVKPRLIVADPPYNFGQEYDLYDDNKKAEEYMTWTRKWLYKAAEVLDPYGSVWVFAPDEWVSEIDVYCKTTLKWYKRSHVVWYYTFGQCNSAAKNFSRSHTHVLYFTAKKTVFTFNGEAVMVSSARQLLYNDSRASVRGKAADNTWMLLKKQMEEVFEPDQDTWLENRVCGTYKERQKGMPNQLPVPLLERIVRATSNPGDLVVDPFLGSGATGVAAVKHGRKFVGFDISKTYVDNARKRVESCRSG